VSDVRVCRSACIALVIGLLLPGHHPAAAQPSALVLVDRDVSVGAGATLSAAAGLFVESAEDRFVPSRLFEERGIARRSGNIAYRTARLLYFDWPQEAWLLVASHEVFGHGARVRELFGGYVRYQIDAPGPYGAGGGVTFYEIGRDVTVHDLQAISVAGMEVNAVAAEQIAEAAFRSGRITPRTALRYLGFELDAFDYIQGTRDDDDRAGHDVADFLELYNLGAEVAGADLLPARTLRRHALVSLANPMLVSAAIGIGRYLATGAADSPVLALGVGPVRMMPVMRYRLTPFGPEWSMTNDMAVGSGTGQVSVRVGRAPLTRPIGVGVAYSGFTVGAWRLGVTLEGWRQPPLARGATSDFGLSLIGRDLEWGGRVRARAESPLAVLWGANAPLMLVIDAGLKSNGFAPGEPIEPGLVLRAGFRIPLDWRR
jgi:hypothetical protein